MDHSISILQAAVQRYRKGGGAPETSGPRSSFAAATCRRCRWVAMLGAVVAMVAIVLYCMSLYVDVDSMGVFWIWLNYSEFGWVQTGFESQSPKIFNILSGYVGTMEYSFLMKLGSSLRARIGALPVENGEIIQYLMLSWVNPWKL